jgi:hypothetical protein
MSRYWRASEGGAGSGPPEYQKSVGILADEEVKLRLYSPGQYEEQLGGEAGALAAGGFVATLKA